MVINNHHRSYKTFINHQVLKIHLIHPNILIHFWNLIDKDQKKWWIIKRAVFLIDNPESSSIWETQYVMYRLLLLKLRFHILLLDIDFESQWSEMWINTWLPNFTQWWPKMILRRLNWLELKRHYNSHDLKARISTKSQNIGLLSWLSIIWLRF